MLSMSRLTAVACMLAGVGLMAQESVGTVRGLVRDEKGAPLANATVKLSGTKLLVPRTVKTTGEGEFRVPVLPPGDYEIVVSREGFIASKATFYLSAGQTMNQPMRLRSVAVASAEVEVVATSGMVDKSETSTKTNLNLDTLQSLPTGSLNSYGALTVAPGITGSVMSPQIRGSVAGQTSFTINGITAKDPTNGEGRQFELVLDDLTEDISVVQSPLNAKNGNTAGGSVNLVTKSGANHFEGSLRVKLTSDSWAAKYPARLNRYGTGYASTGSNNSNDSLSRTYEATISGPVIKDVLTFTYGTRISPTQAASITLMNLVRPNTYDGMPLAGVTANSYGVGPDGQDLVVNGSTKTTFHTGKLYYNIAEGHQLTMSGTRTKYGPSLDTRNQPGTTVDPKADFTQSYTTNIFGVEYHGVVTSSSVLDLRYGTYGNKIHFASGPGLPISTRYWVNDALQQHQDLAAAYGADPIAAMLIGADFVGTSPGRAWTEGSTGAPDEEERSSKTIVANYNLILGDHNMDMGFNQDEQTWFLPQSFGPTSTLYYAPGKTADGKYLAWNFYAPNIGFWNNDVFDDGNRSYMLNNAFSAVQGERRRLISSGDPRAKAKATNNSIYVNDLWQINDHWNVMAGLRFNRWKLTDRTGERISSNGVEPRFQVKYDVNGDNRRMFTLTYAQFRGALQISDVGGAVRVPGNISQRSFWNAGTPGEIYTVTQAEIYNDANYKPYTYSDSDYSREMNNKLKPAVREEITFGYAVNLDGGGSLRTTFIHSNVKDQYYLRGINEANDLPSVAHGVTYYSVPKYYRQVLDFDPYAKRTHRGVEMEFMYPIYRDASQTLTFQGNWTINRDYGRNTFRDNGDGDSAARFDEYMQANNIGIDVNNPMGQLVNSIHNSATAWLTWTVSSKKGVRNTVTLLGSWSSGAPWSVANTYDIPGTSTQFLPKQVAGGPSTFSAFQGGRGIFSNPETFYANLQWNLSIPITKKVVATSYVTVNNLFNTILQSNMNIYGRSPKVGAYVPNQGYVTSNTAAEMAKWGYASLMGARSLSVDFGLKF